MTTHQPQGGQPAGPLFTSKRTKPKGKAAEVGKLGTIANCLGGDEVWVYNRDKSKRYACTIAWPTPDGAMIRWGGRAGIRDLSNLPATAVVEWRKVRPQ